MIRKTKDTIFKIKTIKVSLFSSLSYLCDWVLWGSVLVISIIYRKKTPPRYHEFGLDDNKYSHTYYTDSNVCVPDWFLFLLTLFMPILQVVLNFTVSKCGKFRKLWNIHCGILGFLVAQALQVLIVSILKNTIGAGRPDLIQRCSPSSYTLAPLGHLSNVSICSNRNLDALNDGWRSFPSGHAATSFTSATYSFFIFSTRHNIFDHRSISYKVFLSIIPLIIATFVTATRYSDNRHFLTDLFVGAKIGVFCAYFGYHLYFPWFKSNGANKGKAFPPRRYLCSKVDKFKFWKLPQDDDYEYDRDAIDIDDDCITSASSTESGDIEIPYISSMKRAPKSRSRPQTCKTSYTVRLKKDGDMV